MTDWQYKTLLEELRKLPDRELRLLLIARWLKQEGICEPEMLLPGRTLQDLAKRFEKHLRGKRITTSPAVLHHAALVKLWLRYFQPLVTEYLKVSQQFHEPKKLKLKELGYDDDAIDCCKTTKSPVMAVCMWLHKRRVGDARTLRNAYSRVWSHPTKKRVASL